MKYTFFNTGNSFSFNPRDKVLPGNSAPPVNALEFYKDLVRQHNTPSVYILDNRGEEVKV